MKKMLILFSIVLLGLVIYYLDSQTEWEYILTTEQNNKIYIDLKSIKRQGDIVSVWEKLDPSKTNDSNLKFYKRVLTLRNFSCSSEKYQVVEVFKYPIFARAPEYKKVNDFWHFISNDSIEYHIFSKVCKGLP